MTILPDIIEADPFGRKRAPRILRKRALERYQRFCHLLDRIFADLFSFRWRVVRRPVVRQIWRCGMWIA